LYHGQVDGRLILSCNKELLSHITPIPLRGWVRNYHTGLTNIACIFYTAHGLEAVCTIGNRESREVATWSLVGRQPNSVAV
jgi:hypothetical protein